LSRRRRRNIRSDGIIMSMRTNEISQVIHIQVKRKRKERERKEKIKFIQRQFHVFSFE
jgi:hypothetical protein